MSLPVGVPGVVGSVGEQPVIFRTEGATFAPRVTVANGASVLWRFADGSSSTQATPSAVNYGSAATRYATLLVRPRSAILTINVGYNAGDGAGDGHMPAIDLIPAQRVSQIRGLRNLTGLQVVAVSAADGVANTLTELDVSGCSSLQFVEAYYTTSLLRANLTGCAALRRFCFEMCPLTELLGLETLLAIEDARNRGCAMTTYGWGSNPLTHLWHWCVGSTSTLTSYGLEGRPLPAMSQYWVFGSSSIGGTLTVPGATSLGDLRASDCNYTAADLSANTARFGYLALANNRFNQAAIDNVLATLVAHGQTGGTIILTGPNMAVPSASGLADVATLTAAGATVEINT